jgi:serine/threonine protein kinase
MGTSGYRAPELLRGVKYEYTNKVDIWALGCISYEIVLRKQAFEGDFEVREYSYLENGIEIPILDDLRDDNLEKFLRIVVPKMLDKDPSKRPSAREVKEELDVLRIASGRVGIFLFIPILRYSHIN